MNLLILVYYYSHFGYNHTCKIVQFDHLESLCHMYYIFFICFLGMQNLQKIANANCGKTRLINLQRLSIDVKCSACVLQVLRTTCTCDYITHLTPE